MVQEMLNERRRRYKRRMARVVKVVNKVQSIMLLKQTFSCLRSILSSTIIEEAMG